MVHPEEALLVFLARLAFPGTSLFAAPLRGSRLPCCWGRADRVPSPFEPGRWVTHLRIFGGSPGLLSETFQVVLHHVHDTFVPSCLTNIQRYSPWFSAWADVIEEFIDPLDEHGGRIFGFIDGTVRRCRHTLPSLHIRTGLGFRLHPSAALRLHVSS